MEKRSFTIVSVHDVHGKKKGKVNAGGRFLSSTPRGAASKAATRICRESKIKGQCTMVIKMQETTSGSSKKEYTYKVKRIRDDRTVERDGVEITYKYRTVVTKH
jgi:hypothetical protein